ncbi:MAG TPA: DAK2 domain-containing protein [Anaerolineae bacterium]
MRDSLYGTAAISSKWLQCNGQQLRKLAQAGLFWLEKHHQHVNALNVFPVPDGDTGTNMLLTMRSAYNRIQESQEKHVGKVAEELARGALMGARGNSGVILSQILRGLAKDIKDKATIDAYALADAFEEAAETAYGGVMRPVEGTILTVIREGAEEAADAVQKSRDLRFLLERILERCQQALERTPDMLPILKQAAVVDSGGQGLVYIFEGMLRYVHGELRGEMSQQIATTATVPAQALAVPEGGKLENPYDVQFILRGQNLRVDEVRRRIDAMGDSTVVVGDDTTVKVHVHVQDPGLPLSYGASLGKITDVVVENMQDQMETIVSQPPDVMAGPAMETGQIGVVAVAPGAGLAQIFRSLGAACVVNGGQTNNPSTEEIFQAVQGVPADKVIILPNNKNILLAAEAARDLSLKQVAVVPTRTIPQGISAMLCLNPNGDLTETTAAMETAASLVTTGEITRATRSVTLDGVTVNKGEMIALINGQLCAAGPHLDEVLAQLLAKMEITDRELVAVYYGQEVTRDEAEAMVEQIEDRYPEVEVELLSGGQPHYYYILGAE